MGARLFPAETVHVAAQPSIYSMRIRVTPPAYVGLPAVLLQEGQGTFSAFAGSAALFSLSAPGPLARAAFCPSAGDTVFFNVNGNEARGDVKLLRPCSYTFSLIDTFGQHGDSMPPFFIDRIADEAPLVHFLKPGINKELTPALAETLWIEALDDIGIKECSLRWRKNSEPHDTAHVRDLLGNRPQTELRRQMVWDVRELSLYPGDTLFYWAYVRDNDPYDTTHFSVSHTYWLRLPTFEEIHERLVRQQDATEHSLQSAQEKQDALRSTLSDLMKSTKGKESLTWEQKQIVNDIKESLKAQSDTLHKAVEALKRTIEQLKEHGLSSKDIIDKMDKVRKALEDLARDYGDSLLFERPRQNESVGMQELKESLEKFRKLLPDLAQRLDNALKYLDMLRRDRQLADLAERAEKYGKEQMDLAARSPKGPPWNERQKELIKKIEDLLSDVSRQSDSGSQSPLFSKEEVPSLQQATSQLQAMKNGFPQTNARAEAMERMSAELFSLAQNLRDLQSSAMAAKLKKEKEALMEMAHDALNMAQWQEEMAIESRQSHARGKTAQAQQALKQALFNSAGNLNKLAMTPPQTVRHLMKRFDDAGTDIDKSIDAIKNAPDAFDAMKAAEGGLNGLAFSLLEAAAAMEGEAQGGGMGEMMGGFQRLSGKQAMINFATGQILRQMLGEGDDAQKAGEGGEGRSSGQIEKARKEAQQAQQAIADALQKLADSYGKEAGDGMNKKARDLEEEARRLARMLENPTPEIQDRQQRFLSRMLQTTLSMHKQDEGKEKRKSQSVKGVFSENVQKPAPGEFSDRDAFFQMRQKAFSGNFPESYRFSIKRYFDSLGVLFLKEK
jgi:predicted RNA-binding protein with EMAP domain